MAMTTERIRTYSELIQIPTFMERFQYLKLDGRVGEQTFGYERYLNQAFYHSIEWRQVRDFVISRDLGCDLAVPGHEIYNRICIHHMNPVTVMDIVEATEYLANPEFLVCTTHNTHNAIHYGNASMLFIDSTNRFPFDTIPWKQKNG